MATEGIDTSSHALSLTLHSQAQEQAASAPAATEQEAAPVQEIRRDPPVDRIELSQATRELAREVTDPKPTLQLSPDRLRTLATGQPPG